MPAQPTGRIRWDMVRSDMKHSNIVILAGAGTILTGVGFIYWPLAVIATGTWLIAAALFATKRGGL